MLYIINNKNFLLHAVDYLSRTNILVHMNYLVVSSAIKASFTASERGINDSKDCRRVEKMNMIFPFIELVDMYIDTGSRSLFKSRYYEALDDCEVHIFNRIVCPVIDHSLNMVIVCHPSEDMYIEILCEYIYEKYKLPAINLNTLFTTGAHEPISFDIDLVRENVKAIRKETAIFAYENQVRTESGRLDLMKRIFKRKDKIKVLKDIGIEVDNDLSNESLDKLVIDAWVKDGN